MCRCQCQQCTFSHLPLGTDNPEKCAGYTDLGSAPGWSRRDCTQYPGRSWVDWQAWKLVLGSSKSEIFSFFFFNNRKKNPMWSFWLYFLLLEVRKNYWKGISLGCCRRVISYQIATKRLKLSDELNKSAYAVFAQSWLQAIRKKTAFVGNSTLSRSSMEFLYLLL